MKVCLLVLAVLRYGACQYDEQADYSADYEIPTPRIVAFTPKGLRFVLAHSDGVDLVGLIANINSPLTASASSGHVKREVKRPNNNRWVINEPERVVNTGDVINYKLAVRKWGRTYFSGLKSFRVRTLVTLQSAQSEGIVWPGTELSAYPQYPGSTSKPIVIPSKPGTSRPPPRPAAPVNNKPTSPARPPTTSQVTQQVTKPCQPSLTVVKGKPACKGALIFEEHFDTLNLTTWQYNVRIADTPDYEFVIYDRRPENAYVQDGFLHIKPSLTEKVYGKPFMTSGTLNLEDCTATNTDECSHQANYGFIMPSVISSRLRSAPFFSFKFGRVEVRAKMAAGDWLTSSIFLQPLRNTYGPRYDSGQIRLCLARGNLDLQCDDVDAGVSQVEAGVMLTAGEEALRRDMGSRELAKGWDKEFHVYRTDWTPDKLTFLLDGRVVNTVIPPAEGFFSLADFEETDVNPWKSGTKMAPFDKEFMITLSLGAGGIHDFADTCVNNGQPKPWKNGQPKAKLNFYKEQAKWASTWKSPLQIDYVKVWAI